MMKLRCDRAASALPGHVKNAKAVVKYVYETYKDQVYLSLMNQYTPFAAGAKQFPELARRVTKREYGRLVGIMPCSLAWRMRLFRREKQRKRVLFPMFDYMRDFEKWEGFFMSKTIVGTDRSSLATRWTATPPE